VDGYTFGANHRTSRSAAKGVPVTTVAYLRRHVFPAAFALLPAKMDTPAARALLIAIALQESKTSARAQYNHGPARGFWQFETAGVAGVLTHSASKAYIYAALLTLCYPPATTAVHAAIEHNDVLAAVCARLLLWTDAKPLPNAAETQKAWELYARTWRPGRPHRDTWDANYAKAWAVEAEAA
jgi:hypothetical protein